MTLVSRPLSLSLGRKSGLFAYSISNIVLLLLLLLFCSSSRKPSKSTERVTLGVFYLLYSVEGLSRTFLSLSLFRSIRTLNSLSLSLSLSLSVCVYGQLNKAEWRSKREEATEWGGPYIYLQCVEREQRTRTQQTPFSRAAGEKLLDSRSLFLPFLFDCVCACLCLHNISCVCHSSLFELLLLPTPRTSSDRGVGG